MGKRGGVESISFPSGAFRLVGALYVAAAAGDSPRPTAILLHGMPGAEKNVDIAYRLRDLGWHTLIPHFRGTWGSDGNFDLTTQPDDAIAAVEYALHLPDSWRADPRRIALVGYSFGSRAAIVAARRDARVGAVVSLAGVADFDDLMMSSEFFMNSSHFLRGVSPESLRKQWLALGGEENPIAVVGQLAQPLLIVHGTDDEVIPYFMAPALHEASGGRASLVSLEGADHAFTRQRASMVKVVTDWLEGWARSL
jgi:pimeloyl-ACP methyl ester carboxylesterase